MDKTKPTSNFILALPQTTLFQLWVEGTDRVFVLQNRSMLASAASSAFLVKLHTGNHLVLGMSKRTSVSGVHLIKNNSNGLWSVWRHQQNNSLNSVANNLAVFTKMMPSAAAPTRTVSKQARLPFYLKRYLLWQV